MKRIDTFDFVCVYQQTDYVNQISSHHDVIFLPFSMRTVHLRFSTSILRSIVTDLHRPKRAAK